MISVVIPLYNKAHTIVSTLESVTNQTYSDFEVIIVNDGSTDNSVEVIQRHFSDTRFKIINQENGGVSVARNRGVDEATGEYVAFLDGDDAWHPEYLAIMTKLIQKYPDYGLFLSAGVIQNAQGYYYRLAKGYENYCGPINLFHNPQVFSHTSATIVNKEIFKRTHRFIPSMCNFEDYLASQAVALIAKVCYCGIPLTKYNGDIPGQLTQQNSSSSIAQESVIFYYNKIMQDSLAVGKNKSLEIFLRYIILHQIKEMIIKRKISELQSFCGRLTQPVRNLIKQDLHFISYLPAQLAILYINLTKIRWRLRGYPVVGKEPALELIDNKYKQW